MRKYEFMESYISSLTAEETRDYKLRDGIGSREMKEKEENLGIKIPVDLKGFYEFSYGAVLDEFQILTISEINDTLNHLADIYKETWEDKFLPFIYYLGVGDYVSFDLSKSEDGKLLLMDCFHEWRVDEWQPICYGLDTWLTKMIESKFHPFWLKR
jgi:hypothetical protein